jgi:hypothetical protein
VVGIVLCLSCYYVLGVVLSPVDRCDNPGQDRDEGADGEGYPPEKINGTRQIGIKEEMRICIA